MSARTAANKNRRTDGKKNGPKPQIVVSELVPGDGVDWFTPPALRILPKQLVVTIGKRGQGRAEVTISENSWEHSDLWLHILLDGSGKDGMPAIEEGGRVTLAQLDRLIGALTTARAKAAKLGIITPRPTPKSIEDVLAARQGA